MDACSGQLNVNLNSRNQPSNESSVSDHSAAHPQWQGRYFERQVRAECGRHALNNVVGGPQFLHADLEQAAEDIVAETGDNRRIHVRRRGWYSHGVLAKVLQPRWKLLLRPLQLNQYEWFLQHALVVGAFVNECNQHWTSIVKHRSRAWYVDSNGLAPLELDEDRFIGFLLCHPNSFALTMHEYED